MNMTTDDFEVVHRYWLAECRDCAWRMPATSDTGDELLPLAWQHTQQTRTHEHYGYHGDVRGHAVRMSSTIVRQRTARSRQLLSEQRRREYAAEQAAEAERLRQLDVILREDDR